MDAHLIHHLGLRPTVRRLPMAQMGCAGGAYALTMAADDLAAHPGERVLIVCAELCSLSYQPHDTTAAAACVVHDAGGPGLRLVGPPLNYLLPNTLTDIVYWLNKTGLHFETLPAIIGFVPRVAPELLKWLKQTAADGPVLPDWIVSHTGGPRIMDQLGEALGLLEENFVHSRASLRELGNVASVVVLDVLARTYNNPPAHGSAGLVIAFGPGFTTVASRAQWHR